ncbi:MAG: acyl--CoA ligase [Desulfobacter sp.]|nr:MAG: acyl--CoA ligase [Desulfobacter sp.]
MIKPFPSVIETHAKNQPDHIAYSFFDQPVTYGEFNRQIDIVAGSFLEMGMRPGDRIATLLPQSPAFSTVFMAAGRIGMVVVPLDPRFKVGEMAALCHRTSPKILVTLAFPEEIKREVEQLVDAFSFEAVFSYFGNLDYPKAKPYETLLEGEAKPVPEKFHPKGDDPYIIIFTSGTTGRPKGAVLSHKNTWGMAKATTEAWNLAASDKFLCNMPTSHVAGTHDMLATQFYAGATGVLVPKFDPQETLDIISKEKLTFMGGVPTMYRLIFKNADFSSVDLSSIKCAITSGEPSSAELVQEIARSFPEAKIVASWGMSETGGFFTFTGLDDGAQIVEETEGKPGTGLEMKILDTQNRPVPTGEIGEMWVRGESVISGYMDPEDDIGVFVGGWMSTGDLGALDEKGYLHFMGRIKEMYISGGYNIYPMEIESYLNAYKGVNTSAVLEIPDPLWGETGVAFVIPEPGVELNPEELLAYCKKGMVDYKVPKKIIITQDVPRSLIGKIVKNELRKTINNYLD